MPGVQSLDYSRFDHIDVSDDEDSEDSISTQLSLPGNHARHNAGQYMLGNDMEQMRSLMLSIRLREEPRTQMALCPLLKGDRTYIESQTMASFQDSVLIPTRTWRRTMPCSPKNPSSTMESSY